MFAMASKASSQQTHWLQNFGPSTQSILVSVLAALILFIFRAQFHREVLVLVAEMTVYASLPIVLLRWSTGSTDTSVEILTSNKWKRSLTTTAFAFAGLPLIAQIGLRPLGFGDPFEIISLAMLLNAAWFLAVHSRFAQFERSPSVLASSPVLFLCFMIEKREIF